MGGGEELAAKKAAGQQIKGHIPVSLSLSGTDPYTQREKSDL